MKKTMKKFSKMALSILLSAIMMIEPVFASSVVYAAEPADGQMRIFTENIGGKSENGQDASDHDRSVGGVVDDSGETSPPAEGVEPEAPKEEASTEEEPPTEETPVEYAEPKDPTEEAPGEEAPGEEEAPTEEEAPGEEEAPTEEETPEEEPETGEEPIYITPDASTTDTFSVDTTAPYDGNYLLVANTNTDADAASESTGILPKVDTETPKPKYSEEGVFVTDDPRVYAFDENGRGLIDPASFLPELVIGEEGATPQYSYDTNATETTIRNFVLLTGVDASGKDKYESIRCIRLASGTYCTVWVPMTDPIVAADQSAMTSYMKQLADEFDAQFPKMTNMFGSKDLVDGTYGNGDGKTALICYDIMGDGTSSDAYTAGYFYAADLDYSKTGYTMPGATGNNIDCLHIDSWQGMNRNTTNNTLDPLYSKGTMVHELQHMINFSICRENETTFWSVHTPTYLNEAYSEAASHLCYGEEKSYGRIYYYNNDCNHEYVIASGQVSLLKWGAVDVLSNYSLSYLFGQYIRTQYANGDTIYKDTMNELGSDDNDLLAIIAAKLGVTSKELLLNFRAAVFLKNATGEYGFKGENWAEGINNAFCSNVTGKYQDIPSGAAIVVKKNGSYTPSEQGEHISYLGMNIPEVAVNSVTISGGNAITVPGGTLQLSASVSPAAASQAVIFSIPNEAHKQYATVTQSGLVTALANGTVVVRATSVYDTSKYAEKTITISGQETATDTTGVDTTAPYDGNRLLVANTNTNASAVSESTGILPKIDAETPKPQYSEDGVFSTDDPRVYAFDEDGRGLIEPAAVLPELVIDEGAAPQYSYDINKAEASNYSKGNTRSFYLLTGLNQSGEEQYGFVNCICLAVGTYCTVWIPMTDPIYSANASAMTSYMQQLANEFDAQFPKMTNMFGSKEIADRIYGDNDGKTALICYDIMGDGTSSGAYIAGYFFGADLNINFSNKTGNNIDCLHIDSWQGMDRNTANNTLEPLYSKGTMVHELQHMINFSICREKETTFGSITTPDYLNEAYSESASHLCYGAAQEYGRILNYNQKNDIITTGQVSLLQWGAKDLLSNYSLSYLFGQYIRTQYASGATIYKDAMNTLGPNNKDLLAIIAAKLGVTSEELLLNFRAALYLKSATGKYGFKGEEWAKAIHTHYAQKTNGKSTNIPPGAALIVEMDGNYTPSGQGTNISYLGMNTQNKESDAVSSVTISGGDSITVPGGTLQLSASVLPEAASQAVIFSIPDEAHRQYATVTESGLVTALANGTVVVGAFSVYDPSKYAVKTITISGQRNKVTGIELDKTTAELYTNKADKPKTLTLTPVITPNDADAKSLIWSSSNESVATVEPDSDGNGIVTALSPGTAVISASADGITASSTVKVKAVIESITVTNPQPLAISSDGGTLTISVNITPSNASKDALIYKVEPSDRAGDEQGLAHIDDNGKLTAIKDGIVKVTVSANDGGNAEAAVVYVTISGQTSLKLIVTEEKVLGGVRIMCYIWPEDAAVYYTTDGSKPTTDSPEWPKEGILLDTAEMLALNFLGHDPQGRYADRTSTKYRSLPVLKAPEISVSGTEAEGYDIMLSSEDEEAEIYYTTDGTQPAVENGAVTNGNKYTGSFKFTVSANTNRVKAMAVKAGAVASPVAEHRFTADPQIEKIELNLASATLYTDRTAADKTVTLIPSITPAEAANGVALEWRSQNPDVASVEKDSDGSGIVTALSPGKTTISVSADGKTASCDITVKSNESGSDASVGIVIELNGIPYSYSNSAIRSDVSYTYTGSANKPGVRVTNNGVPLREGTDYTVKYANNVKVPADNATDANKPKVIITGKNNMQGNAVLYFSINKRSIEETESGIAVSNPLTVVENSKAAPVLYYSGMKLTVNKDFRIDETNKNKKWKPEETGGKITLTGIGNYTGTREIDVNVIAKSSCQKFSVTPDSSMKDLTYDGSQHVPVFDVNNSKSKQLLNKDDYYVVYPADMVNAGVKKFTVVGTGIYTGCSVTKSYTIKPCKDQSKVRIDNSGIKNQYAFRKTGVTFEAGELKITGNGLPLYEGEDYKITYSGNKKVGTAKYKVTFLGNYKGMNSLKNQDGSFKIAAAKLSDLEWKAVALDKVYKTPGIYKTKLYVTVDNTLLKTSDYTVIYKLSNGEEMKGSSKLDLNHVSGTVTVRIKGKGNYSGESEIKTSYEVRENDGERIDLSKAKVTVVEKNTTRKLKKVPYDGTEKKPELYIQIKEGKSYREADKDEYAALEPHITYVNNVNKGTATVIVNGDGEKFIGSKTATFTIVQKNITSR